MKMDDHSEDIYNLILQNDNIIMPPPPMDFDAESNILITKVRKHYYNYVITELSLNYSAVHRLPKTTVRLPSAVYKCAKQMEMKAAQACMLLQLYRKNVLDIIKTVKKDTEKHRLNKNLLQFLTVPCLNDKCIQVNMDNTYLKRKKKDDVVSSDKGEVLKPVADQSFNLQSPAINQSIYSIPDTTVPLKKVCATTTTRLSTDSLVESDNFCNREEDEVLKELEKLFHDDTQNSEDELFEGTLCDSIPSSTHPVRDTPPASRAHDLISTSCGGVVNEQLKSLDERLAMLENFGILKQPQCEEKKLETPSRVKEKVRKVGESKWLCEMYYQRNLLSEKLYDTRERNTTRHHQIKSKMELLFGCDSEDEEMVSPAEENINYVASCKERIAPWIVKKLTPYYMRGVIVSKPLFKSLAKHILSIIIEGNRYPEEYDIHVYVKRFFLSHPKIRCEADFKY